jgi:hypothetical protein
MFYEPASERFVFRRRPQRVFHSDQGDQIGRCYDFLKIFAEKFSEKMAFLAQNKAKL